MQRIYIFAFNTAFKVTGRLKESVRNLVLFLCCLELMRVYFFSGRDVMTGEIQIYCSVITVIIILFSINSRVGRIEWNKFAYYPLVAFGIGILLIGQLHTIGDGYVMYALDLIAVFPALYFVYANRGDHETLYKLMSLAIFLLGICSFVYCCYLAMKGMLPIRGGRVLGIRSNPNTFARLGVIILLSGIYLTWEHIDRGALSIVFSPGIGIGLTFIILSVSRTAFITAVIFFIILLVFVIKNYKKQKNSDRLLLIALATAVSAMVLITGMQIRDINSIATGNAVRGRSLPVASESSAARSPNKSAGTVYATDATQPDMSERLGPSGDLNAYSSGRIARWNVYIQNFSLFGKPYSELEPQFGTERVLYAHNNIIEYIYRCGYIVGGIYVLFFIAQGVTGLRIMFSRKYFEAKYFFVIAAVGMYSVLAMLDVETLAFGGCFPCIYFLSVAPIVTKGKADGG